MLIFLIVLQVFFVSVCETQRIANTRPTRIPRRTPPNVKCIEGCICSRRSWYSIRTVDCSDRNLTKIPSGQLGRRDHLVLKGNNIKLLQHSDFDQYTNLYGLDLRDNPIDVIPMGVFFNMRLRKLLITTNKMHHFAFHGLTELDTLHIDGTTSITDLHTVLLKPLKDSLRNLTITNTNIANIGTHTLAGMHVLKFVDLRNNRIERIASDAFDGSAAITTVLLSHNNIKNLAKIFQGQSIRELRIDYNQISSISDDTFVGMVNLNSLDLSNNKLNKLDSKLFDKASHLGSVYLQGNQLKSVPTALLPGKCSSLRFLDLSDNKIDKFFFSNSDAKTNCVLNTLKLRGNQLTLYNVTSLDRLSNLDISKNCHLNFTESYLGDRLSYIDLSECCLTELPNYIETRMKASRFRSINTLNLHGNRFTNFTLTSELLITNLNLSSNNLDNLTLYFPYLTFGVFDLSNNNLATIVKGSTYGTMRMRNLILRNNSFDAFNLTWITNLHDLDLSYNKIKSVPSLSQEVRNNYRTGLSGLNLQGNQISDIKKEAFDKLRFLNALDLSHNKISHIDVDVFMTHTYLRTLDLSGNELTSLTAEIFHLSGLQTLNLSYNRLCHIDESAFDNMMRLTEIDISNNQLQTLPMGLSKFTETYREAISLDISGNNLTCSCDIQVMLSYYKKFRPIGSCHDAAGGVQKQLQNFIMTFEELTKSSCNLCPMSPCKYKGQCVNNTVSGFKCNCYQGYTGPLCDVAHFDCKNGNCSVCSSSTCLNGGVCVEDEGNRTCICQTGYSGAFCEAPKCYPNPCNNGGHCFTNNSKSICKCQPSYIGERCDVYKGLCNPSTCNDHGVCITGDGRKEICYCHSGFSGEKCQEKEFNNNKQANASGSSGSSSKTIAIAVLVVLLVVAVVILVVVIRKHGLCRKDRSNDRMELVNDFE